MPILLYERIYKWTIARGNLSLLNLSHNYTNQQMDMHFFESGWFIYNMEMVTIKVATNPNEAYLTWLYFTTCN